MKKIRWTKILVGVLLLASFLVILSLLTGAQWILNVVLAFTDDTLCEDMNQDGIDDFCQFWENGELLRLEWDTNFDGKVDVWQSFEGELEVFQMDANHDEQVDYREEQLDDGRVKIEIDSDYDGQFDRTMIQKEGNSLLE